MVKLHYKTCREQAGLMQSEAIALLGIANTESLSRYETGKSPVSAELVAKMVEVYNTPRLANWHVRHTNPELAKYLPEIDKPITDGDSMLQLELSDDDIRQIRDAIKLIFKDGVVTPEEKIALKENAQILRNVANRILSTAIYLETRRITADETKEVQEVDEDDEDTAEIQDDWRESSEIKQILQEVNEIKEKKKRKKKDGEETA